MIKKLITYLLLAAILATGFSGCKKEPPKIYLYGERVHGTEMQITKEYELWYNYYHNDGMRHLFLENSYAGAQLLNIWMQSEDDAILDELREDLKGTSAYAEIYWEFYRLIKENCPETVFHGTDIGHQYDTVGARYLEYLEENGMSDSEEYNLTLENIEQGKNYYEMYDPNSIKGLEAEDFRENMMAQNFIREFDSLGGESIMGIYGGAHTTLDGMSFYNSDLPCMANAVSQHYGETVTMLSTPLDSLVDSPIAVETLTVNGKDYAASHYGSCYVANIFEDYEYLDFWRLENAYEDFKDFPKSNSNANSLFPMPVAENDILVVDLIAKDGTLERKIFRSFLNNGNVVATEIFV